MKHIRRLLDRVLIAHKDEHDTVWIITGGEGFGKSNLLLDIVDEWGKMTNQTFTIDNIGLTPQGWVKAISIAEPHIGIAPFDEAGDGLLSRDAMSDFNKDVIKMYTVIRGKGLFTILVLPSFWYLDKFFRMHRVKGLFHVYNRGRVAFWNKRQIQQMILKGEDHQDIWAVKPCLRDAFPKYDGYLKEDYKKLKAQKIASSIQQMQEKYSEEGQLTERQKEVHELRSKGVKLKDIADAQGVSVGAVSNILESLKKKGYKYQKNRETGEYQPIQPV